MNEEILKKAISETLEEMAHCYIDIDDHMDVDTYIQSYTTILLEKIKIIQKVNQKKEDKSV